MITSAAARSIPRPASPAITPISQAMPVTPPPPRTSARLSMTSLVHPPGAFDSGTGKRHSAVHCRHGAAGRGRARHHQTPRIREIAGPARADATPPTGHAGYPDSTPPGISSRDRHDGQLASGTSRRRSPAVLPAPPGRRSPAQGRWSVARAPVTGWTDHDRGPPGRRGGTDQIRAPRNRDPRQAEEGPLVASGPDHLPPHTTLGVSGAPVAVHAIGQ